MHIRKDVSLANYSTMRLGGKAKYLVSVTEKSDIPNALDWAEKKKLKVIMIGQGSNIVWKDSGFDGLVILNEIKGYKKTKLDDETYAVQVGAGENWDQVVEKTVKAGLHGIEALSLIPGTAGATPIQNVGAYGQEVADTIISVEAYDTKTDSFVTIPNEACGFGYRTSRFKTTDRGRFYIYSLTFCLTAEPPTPPFYRSLQMYIDHLNITEFTPKLIREFVIAIRSSKLPDPKKVANNGSFFANPIITESKYKILLKKYPSLPGWPNNKDKGKVKIPAAWLIESAGFKNFHDLKTGMATWPKQSLVLVNEKAKSTSDLIAFRNRIIREVDHKFGITLEQEPELLPS